MTDTTKAISGGWIAPYWGKDGGRDIAFDLRVEISADPDFPIVLIDEASCLRTEIPIDQAKALIDALRLAIAHVEARP